MLEPRPASPAERRTFDAFPEQIGLEDLDDYGARSQTRSDQLAAARAHAGFRSWAKPEASAFVRDLVRAREAVRADLLRCRTRRGRARSRGCAACAVISVVPGEFVFETPVQPTPRGAARPARSGTSPATTATGAAWPCAQLHQR
jgi:hypothetical protein